MKICCSFKIINDYLRVFAYDEINTDSDAVFTMAIFNEGIIDFSKAGGKGTAQISFLHLIL